MTEQEETKKSSKRTIGQSLMMFVVYPFILVLIMALIRVFA